MGYVFFSLCDLFLKCAGRIRFRICAIGINDSQVISHNPGPTKAHGMVNNAAAGSANVFSSKPRASTSESKKNEHLCVLSVLSKRKRAPLGGTGRVVTFFK